MKRVSIIFEDCNEAERFADMLYECVEFNYPALDVQLVEKVRRQIEEKI